MNKVKKMQEEDWTQIQKVIVVMDNLKKAMKIGKPLNLATANDT